MSSSKKRPSNRKIEIPDWATDVKPADDVMAMFYAPTGQPRPGPLIPLPPTDTAAEPSQQETSGEAVKAEEIPVIEQPAALQQDGFPAPPPPQEPPEVIVPPELETSPDTGGAEIIAAESIQTTPTETQVTPPAPAKKRREPDAAAPRPESLSAIPSGQIDAKFEAHYGQWRPFLTERQLKVLRILYGMTHAQGRDECLTSTLKLAAAAGLSPRRTSDIVQRLEAFGFIARPETYNTRTTRGTIFRLYLMPQRVPQNLERQYHTEE